MRKKPIACTLSEADLGCREAAWHSVLRENAFECSELENGFALSINGTKGVLREVGRLAELESACCPWMSISIVQGDPIRLLITSEMPDGKDVIAMLVPPSLRRRAG